MATDGAGDTVDALKAQVRAMRTPRDKHPSSQNASTRRLDDGAAPVSIDVGGTVYTACASTWNAVETSHIARAVSGKVRTQRTHAGNLFVDRDAQIFRYVASYLRSVARHAKAGGKESALAPFLPSSSGELALLVEEAKFYGLSGLQDAAAAALAAAEPAPPSSDPTSNGPITPAAAASVTDDGIDVWNKASRMRLEFQSVYITILSESGLQFKDADRSRAMEQVNARTSELQASGFRVKAMNTGVAQDRKTKDYCMYFHAVLVRNTGKRVPGPFDTAGGTQRQIESTDSAALNHTGPSRAHGVRRSTRAPKAHSDAPTDALTRGMDSHPDKNSSSLAPNTPHAPQADTETEVDNPVQTTSHVSAPGQDDEGSSMSKAPSKSGRSFVNTSASTIDSILAAGNGNNGAQLGASGAGGAQTATMDAAEAAHAAAIANMALPTENAPRVHREAAVYDIKLHGRPAVIPEEWDVGLLEGRARPAGKAADKGADKGSNKAAGQQAADAKVEVTGTSAPLQKPTQLPLQAPQHVARAKERTSKEHSRASQGAAPMRHSMDHHRPASRSLTPSRGTSAQAQGSQLPSASSNGFFHRNRRRSPRTSPPVDELMRSKSDLHLFLREINEETERAERAHSSELAQVNSSSQSLQQPLTARRFKLPSGIRNVFDGSTGRRTKDKDVSGKGRASTTARSTSGKR